MQHRFKLAIELLLGLGNRSFDFFSDVDNFLASLLFLLIHFSAKARELLIDALDMVMRLLMLCLEAPQHVVVLLLQVVVEAPTLFEALFHDVLDPSGHLALHVLNPLVQPRCQVLHLEEPLIDE